MASKQEEDKSTRAAPEDTLPAYEAVNAGPPGAATSEPLINAAPTDSAPTDSAPLPAKNNEKKTLGPTSDSPFNFPSNAPPPSYSAGSSSSSNKPIAVPQSNPTPTAPFISAYAAVLLGHGITPDTWRSFLETLSAFLAAKVSDRAISHASDVAKKLGEGPGNIAKGIFSHAKDVGRNIGNNVKRGNVLGAAMGVVGGAISIPVSAAVGTVHAVVQLPGSTASAVAKKPKTPRERAAAYIAVANRDWLESRGLHADLLDTQELCQAVGVSTAEALGPTRASKDNSAEAQLAGLQRHILNLEFQDSIQLDLGEKTLWVVLVSI